MKFKIVDCGHVFFSNCQITAIMSYKNRVKGAKLVGKPFKIELFKNNASIAQEFLK